MAAAAGGERESDPRPQLELYGQIADSLRAERGRIEVERRAALAAEAEARASVVAAETTWRTLADQVERQANERDRLRVRRGVLADSVRLVTAELEGLRGHGTD